MKSKKAVEVAKNFTAAEAYAFFRKQPLRKNAPARDVAIFSLLRVVGWRLKVKSADRIKIPAAVDTLSVQDAYEIARKMPIPAGEKGLATAAILRVAGSYVSRTLRYLGRNETSKAKKAA